jgi:hypothetical protein
MRIKRNVLDISKEFAKTMQSINGHLGYQFTQPIMEFMDRLEQIENEVCATCAFWSQITVNEINCHRQDIFTRPEEFCSRWTSK